MDLIRLSEGYNQHTLTEGGVDVLPNYKLDGDFETSHFTDADFNNECARALESSLLGFLVTNKSKPVINIIDVGAGSGDLIAAIKAMFDNSERVQEFMRANSLFKSQIRLAAVEVDKTKLVAGKRRRAAHEVDGMHIIYQQSDLTKLHEIPQLAVDKTPTFIIQRSVTHYFVSNEYDPANPNTWSENGYTQEQLNLLNYYSDHLHTNHINPGSMIAMIESTGPDQIGLRRFEYLLANIAGSEQDYKRLRYLSPDEFSGLTKAASSSNTRAKIKSHAEPTKIKGQHGNRNIEKLWERYGNGLDLAKFRGKVLSLYEKSEKLFDGDTSMITRTYDNEGNPDIVIGVDYILNTLSINSRRRR